MSIVTPSETAAGYLAQFTIGQQRYDITEQSDASGHTATRLGAPPRWRLSFRTLDALPPAISGLWKAIALQLKGRINHLGMWDVTHPEPAGTARGALATSGTTAIGATSVAITGALAGSNLISSGGFEIDTGADGMADGWSAYAVGSTGAIVYSRPAGNGSAYAQRCYNFAHGSGSGDRSGIKKDAYIPVSEGASYDLIADVLATIGVTIRLWVDWYTAGGAPTGSSSSASFSGSGAWERQKMTATAPVLAAQAQIFVWIDSAVGGPIQTLLDVDNVCFQAASSSDEYPGLATLLAGDWLQIGTGVGTSHYCMATADATANDAGAITVTFQPPTRISFAGATAVAWEKPLCYYRQAADVSQWSGAAGSTDVGGFAFDLVENWRA